MFLLEAFALSGLFYAGSKLAGLRKSAVTPPPRSNTPLADPEKRRHEQALAGAGRDLRVSQVALSLAVAGSALRAPLLGFASLPAMLVVFAPVYGQAWQAVRARRVDLHLLDAVRISVCVVMGYTVIAALNALLHAWSQRMFLRSEETLRGTLQASLGLGERTAWIECQGVETQTPLEQVKPGMVMALRTGDAVQAAGLVIAGRASVAARFAEDQPVWVGPGDRLTPGSRVLGGEVRMSVERVAEWSDGLYRQLQEAPLTQTPLQRVGERTGGGILPWMLASFALTTPLMGVNRAAAFLTTSFGAQMHRLSPYSVREFSGFAAPHGIFIRDPRALELANLTTTVIFDARVLEHPAARPHAAGLLHALRVRHWPAAEAMSKRFSAYAMASSEQLGQSLVDELGLDGYYVEAEGNARAALIEHLQLSGKLVCYVSGGGHDQAAMDSALLSVEVREASDLRETQAQIVLLDPRLRGLPGVFDLALAFADKQKFNLLNPVAVDFVDISTTVFLHFGLVYSVLLSYTGLLSSVVHARLPKNMPYAPGATAPPDFSAEASRQIA